MALQLQEQLVVGAAKAVEQLQEQQVVAGQQLLQLVVAGAAKTVEQLQLQLRFPHRCLVLGVESPSLDFCPNLC